jgi:hypothetical protein
MSTEIRIKECENGSYIFFIKQALIGLFDETSLPAINRQPDENILSVRIRMLNFSISVRKRMRCFTLALLC